MGHLPLQVEEARDWHRMELWAGEDELHRQLRDGQRPEPASPEGLRPSERTAREAAESRLTPAWRARSRCAGSA